MELKEIKNVLRIDEDDTANDEILESLLLAFPKWLSTHSGLSELRQQDNKVVDTLCGLWIRKQYFSYDDVKVDRAIEQLLRTVSLMATASEKEYADLVATENKLYLASEYGVDGWESVQVSIPEPVTMSRTITANGSYCCSDENSEAVGYSEVVVDVPSPELDTLLVTSSGEYNADSELVYGWNKVVVDVKAEANVGRLDASTAGVYYAKDEGLDGYEVVNVLETVELEPLAITQNGTYEPEEGKGFGSVSVNVSAESGENSEWENRYFDLVNNVATVPYFYEGQTVIANYAFAYKNLIGELELPSSVLQINMYAFAGCKNFTGNLVIPDKVVTIASYAFSGCSGFNGKLVLSDSLQTIGNNAFYWIPDLTGDVDLGEHIESIGSQAFYSDSGLGDFIIRNTSAVVALTNSNAFTSTKVKSGTAYIYVPDVLDDGTDGVSAYASATNWSTYAAQIKPLSEYTGGSA